MCNAVINNYVFINIRLSEVFKEHCVWRQQWWITVTEQAGYWSESKISNSHYTLRDDSSGQCAKQDLAHFSLRNNSCNKISKHRISFSGVHQQFASDSLNKLSLATSTNGWWNPAHCPQDVACIHEILLWEALGKNAVSVYRHRGCPFFRILLGILQPSEITVQQC